MTSGCARSLQIEGWANWNAASPSLLPAELWKQYETPEEAGSSSEKLSAVQEMSNKADSAAVKAPACKVVKKIVRNCWSCRESG